MWRNIYLHSNNRHWPPDMTLPPIQCDVHQGHPRFYTVTYVSKMKLCSQLHFICVSAVWYYGFHAILSIYSIALCHHKTNQKTQFHNEMLDCHIFFSTRVFWINSHDVMLTIDPYGYMECIFCSVLSQFNFSLLLWTQCSN